jgi:hypothetical protein
LAVEVLQGPSRFNLSWDQIPFFAIGCFASVFVAFNEIAGTVKDCCAKP